MGTEAIFFAAGGMLMLICQILSLVFLRKHKNQWIHPLVAMSPIILMSLHPMVPEIIHNIFMKGIGHKMLITAMQWTVVGGVVYFWNKNRKAAMCNIIMLPLTIIDVILHVIFGAVK